MNEPIAWRLRISWGLGAINVDDYHQSKFEDPSKENLERIANEISKLYESHCSSYFYELRTIDQIIKYKLDAILHIVVYPEKQKIRGD